MLTSLFLSFKNILRDKNPDDLAQNEADNCFIISCPLDNKKSPEDSSKERKTVSSGSDGTHSTPGMCLPASCFLTVMGQGDDDPSLPPEQKDGDVLASDICPICQEPLADNTVELTHCCGRLFHAHCLDASSSQC